jgi:signal transduction histidine kinase
VSDQEQSSREPAIEPVVGHAHPELAQALRSRIGEILLVWEGRMRKAFASVADATFSELADGIPALLGRLADAIATGQIEQTFSAIQTAPEEGIARHEHLHSVRELISHHGLLRCVVIEESADALGRPMAVAEQVMFHFGFDLIVRQAVVSYVESQEQQTRAAADVEAKYLSFLSHDLSNHLSGVTIWLKLLRQQLSATPASEEAVATLDVVQRSIGETVGGIERLLHSERLRRHRTRARAEPVDVFALVTDTLRQFTPQAREKGLELALDVEPGVEVKSDREILGLVLNNLLGNAVKYSARGTVRIGCQRRDGTHAGRWGIYVADEGPGIGSEHLSQIFESFRRGDSHGQAGLGLGLAIASHAARLLGAELAVDSQLGKGSVFWLTLAREES